MRRPEFEVFEGRGGFYWRLVASNRKVVATGGERFPTRSNATRAARRVCQVVLDWHPSVRQVRSL